MAQAQLTVGYQGLKETYTSIVTANAPHSIRAVSHDSNLFKSLDSLWMFEAVSKNATRVQFEISYEFSNPI